mgnify:CR=1 FL=1
MHNSIIVTIPVPEVVLLKRSLTPGARILYMLLWRHRTLHPDKEWPTRRQLAYRMGKGYRSSERMSVYMRELTDAGLMTVERIGIRNSYVLHEELLLAKRRKSND